MNEKYCAYLRKSRADRDAEMKGAEETLARHKRILTEFSEKAGKPISKFYSEVVSGETIADRPAMQELLADVEAGLWTGVYVVELERLARGNTRDQGIVSDTFKYSDTIILTPSKIYDPDNESDEEYFEFGLFMSRREYKTINRRLQRGRTASVKEGNFVVGVAPYGYRKVKLPKGYTLEPVPEQAEIVQKIFNWYCHGEQQPDGTLHRLGSDSIARKLDSLGIKPLINEKWSRATISDMLTNPTYTGKVFFGRYKDIKSSVNGRIVKKRVYNPDYLIAPGKHPAIIDDELFTLAKKIRKINRKNTVPTSSSLQNPLSGLIYCKRCGSLMTRLAPNSRNKYATLKCPNRYCSNISSPIFLVERQILQFLRNWLHTYEINSRIADFSSPYTDEINSRKEILSKIDHDVSRLSSQLNRAYDLLEQEVYSLTVFQERQSTLKSSIAALDEEKQKVEKELQNFYHLKETHEQFAPKVKHLLDSYESNTVESNNIILQELIDRITYDKTERNTRGNLENCNFVLDIFPSTPL